VAKSEGRKSLEVINIDRRIILKRFLKSTKGGHGRDSSGSG
jgi:hypothetical protein